MGKWHNDLKLEQKVAASVWVLAVKLEVTHTLSQETEIALMKGIAVTLPELSSQAVTFALCQSPGEAIRRVVEGGNNFTCQVCKWAALCMCVCVGMKDPESNEMERLGLWLEVGTELFPNPQDLFVELVGVVKLAAFRAFICFRFTQKNH